MTAAPAVHRADAAPPPHWPSRLDPPTERPATQPTRWGAALGAALMAAALGAASTTPVVVGDIESSPSPTSRVLKVVFRLQPGSTAPGAVPHVNAEIKLGEDGWVKLEEIPARLSDRGVEVDLVIPNADTKPWWVIIYGEVLGNRNDAIRLQLEASGTPPVLPATPKPTSPLRTPSTAEGPTRPTSFQSWHLAAAVPMGAAFLVAVWSGVKLAKALARRRAMTGPSAPRPRRLVSQPPTQGGPAWQPEPNLKAGPASTLPGHTAEAGGPREKETSPAALRQPSSHEQSGTQTDPQTPSAAEEKARLEATAAYLAFKRRPATSPRTPAPPAGRPQGPPAKPHEPAAPTPAPGATDSSPLGEAPEAVSTALPAASTASQMTHPIPSRSCEERRRSRLKRLRRELCAPHGPLPWPGWEKAIEDGALPATQKTPEEHYLASLRRLRDVLTTRVAAPAGPPLSCGLVHIDSQDGSLLLHACTDPGPHAAMLRRADGKPVRGPLLFQVFAAVEDQRRHLAWLALPLGPFAFSRYPTGYASLIRNPHRQPSGGAVTRVRPAAARVGGGKRLTLLARMEVDW